MNINKTLKRSTIIILIIFGYFLVKYSNDGSVYDFALNLFTEIIGITITVFYIERWIRDEERKKFQKLGESTLNRLLRLTKETMFDVQMSLPPEGKFEGSTIEVKNRHPEIFKNYHHAGDYGYECEILLHQEYYIKAHINFLVDQANELVKPIDHDKEIRKSIREYQVTLRDIMDYFGDRLPNNILEIITETTDSIDGFFQMCAWYNHEFNEPTYEIFLRDNLCLSYAVAKELGKVYFEIEVQRGLD